MSAAEDEATRVKRVTLVVFVTLFLDMIGYGLVIPMLPLYVKSLGGDPSSAGLIITTFAATQLIATPIMGRLSDKYGRRRVIVTSLAGNALSMVVFALATTIGSLPLVYISRIVAGATAGNMAACQACIADVTRPEDRARGMGMVGASIGLGMVFGPVTGGFLSHYGTWLPPMAAALAAFGALALAFFILPETRWLRSGGGPGDQPSLNTAPRFTFRSMLGVPTLVLVFALYFLVFLTMTNTQVSVALLAGDRLAWTEKEIGYLFGAFGFVMLVVQGGLMGRLSRAFGETRLILMGTLLTAAGMYMMAHVNSAEVMVSACLIYAVGMGVCNPSLSSLASKYAPPDQQGVVLGFAQSSGTAARTIGPTLSGLLYDHFGSSAPFYSGTFTSLLAIGVVVYFMRQNPPEERKAAAG